MTTSALQSQEFQGFPKLDVPIVDEGGYLARPWHRFFISIFRRLGGSFSEIASSVFFSASGAELGVYSNIDASLLGTLLLTGAAGGPAQPQAPSTSPFIYTATNAGTLVVFAAEVELSRDNGITWYKVTLTGGAIPMLALDRVRVTWYGPSVPEVTFFPDNVPS